MADLFGRVDQVYNGGLTTDNAILYWDGLPNFGLGLLVTNIAAQYQQPIRRIYEIGPQIINPETGTYGLATYYVAGRTEGTLQLGRVVGPGGILSCFYARYGNPCNVHNLDIYSSAGCIDSFSPDTPNLIFVKWHMRSVLISALGIATSSQEMMITENISALFIGLNIASAAPVLNGGVLIPGVWTDINASCSQSVL